MCFLSKVVILLSVFEGRVTEITCFFINLSGRERRGYSDHGDGSGGALRIHRLREGVAIRITGTPLRVESEG